LFFYFFAVVSSTINGVLPSFVRITFNKTEEVIVPVLYSPFTAFPSACVNAIAGVDVGSSLLQLTIDTAINKKCEFLDHKMIV
jgi:hypothetical protein